jgi:hypothetical protein
MRCNQVVMSDQPSGRDEKGLTISGRTMLRLLTEFGKVLAASRKLGDKSGYELLQTPTITLEIRSLLWIAMQMAKRIGSNEEVEAYLKKHSEADEKVIFDGMSETGKAILEEAMAHGGVPKCTSCGKVVCPICKECHSCTNNLGHDMIPNPFGNPGSKAPN